MAPANGGRIHLRDRRKRHLRMANAGPHRVGMEPLARLVREAMDAADLRVSDVARLTGLHRQHVSQIVNRAEPYTREPEIETMQALALIPGLSIERIALAVAESTGRPLPSAPDLPTMTPMRRSVHAVVDKIAEDDLPRALQILTALL